MSFQLWLAPTRAGCPVRVSFTRFGCLLLLLLHLWNVYNNEQTVNELEAENKRLLEEHSEKLRTFRLDAEETQKQLIETHRLTIQDLTNWHEQDLSAVKQQAENELANLQQVVHRICFDISMNFHQ